ncbi:MAG: carboxypeptidase regulatory-like domain-containing protein [Kofleriaceae bacterium]|nr:carboxypeptidase regulatory-like domain-containing protein [Kofleriaceae bacterium]
MRTLRIAIAASVFTLLAACGGRQRTHITGGVLGRVVVYRNGVAFYERRATVEDGRLVVRVPRERVDDFLKSLTVVDPNTRKPLSVTIPRHDGGDGQHLTMRLETSDVRHANVLLTYVTEAPSWKPSYRVVVGKGGKVMLEGWAVVDNTTSEDWNGVLVGVGASSALAFRYDLWSVRQVDRDLLRNEEKFAIAPPTGLSPFRGGAPEELASFGANNDDLGVSFSGSTSVENSYSSDRTSGGAIQGIVTDSQTGEKLPGVTVVATHRGSNETRTAITDDGGQYKLALPNGEYVVTFYYAAITLERSGVKVATNKVTPVFQKINQARSGGEVVKIVDSVPSIDPTSTTQSIRIDKKYTKNIPLPGRAFEGSVGSAPGRSSIDRRRGIGDDFGGFDGPPHPSSSYASSAPSPPARDLAAEFRAQFDPIVARYRADKRDLVVETSGPSGYPEEVSKRGESLKNKLVDAGIPADKVHVVPKLVDGGSFGTRVLAVNEPPKPAATPPTRDDLGPDTPVGESHFMADRAMTVRSGSSAMVAMLHRETTGGVVYFYDPISERGDKRFAFKAVRLDNPTGDTLEPGPVTVYGDGRFIGEGITEPVPPHAAVVVPFALDKQVVVTADNDEEDRIAKLITVQRGVLTADIQHRRNARYTVTSRLTTPATVYLRHRLETGWTLVDAPKSSTRVGDSQLFEIVLGPGETKEVVIASATPLQRTFQLGAPEVLGMMRVFVDEPSASPQLKAQIEALLATHRAGADLDDKIAMLRDQLAEYRSRSGELHAQIVTLKAVRTGGELMIALKGKLSETSDRIQKTTIAIVEAQEQMMLTRVKFQNQLAELRLNDATAVTEQRPGGRRGPAGGRPRGP